MNGDALTIWRREQRTKLLARRQEMELAERQSATRAVAEKLDQFVATAGFRTIGLYWPIKHEINLLPWAEALAERGGAELCLPVVVARKSPLEYRRWRQGEPLERGIWDIPIPAKRDLVTPDLMLAPLVGFDRANYRLGYGGGYFDRTLASLARRPAVIGIGYDFSALDTIFPQPYNIPMDALVTERHDTLPPDRRPHADRA